MIMLTIPPIFPVAIEMAFKAILIIDKMTVTIQAHPIPFSSPYATMNDAIPKAIITPPITMAPPPRNEGAVPERYMPELGKFPFWKADGGSEERNVLARTRRTPPTSMVTPPMILRTAIIVTPVGRDLGVPCKM
jgi:hypothetical protein